MSGEVENVRVVVRVRPLNEKEVAAGYRSIVEVDPISGSVLVKNPNTNDAEPPKIFTFDTVFGIDTKQMDVFNLCARPIIENVLMGYNGTIFAYGQTGTGKTFTMAGDRSDPKLKGIIPNAFAHVFGQIAKAGETKNFLVRVSYLEIYNEEVRDLLGKDQNIRLEVKERPDVGVYVKDLSGYVVNTADDMDKIMTLGNKNRSVGATNMNAHSSRSHAIFTITVECSDKGLDGQQHVRMGKLHLVDLAGSERQSKSGATGQRLKEATKINLSLSTLGNVISALVDGKSTHVPYRNSKLTRLLQDSLGGNAKTVMCANIGPAEYNYDESISTLRYANRAKNIKNRARINEDPKDALMRQFQNEIKELRRLLEEGSEEDSEDDDESGDTDSDEVVAVKTKATRGKGRQLEELKAKVESERRKLEEQKDMEQSERDEAARQLQRREEELRLAETEFDQMMEKLQGLEKKIIVGGENLLEKAEVQERLLEESAKELEERREKELALKVAIEKKEAERVDIEERYSSLQEEAAGKTKKLKRVHGLLQSAKGELADLQQEQQREMEGLLDNIRQLTREIRLQSLIIDSFVPGHYQDQIEKHARWNEDVGEWQLKCVAYTGNNMRKQDNEEDQGHDTEYPETDMCSVYLSYSSEGVTSPVRPRTARAKSALLRPRSQSGVRPKSSKR